MNIQKIKRNEGFVILFAVTLAAVLLSIALGVANIALKEIKFGTSAKDTNDAFFAADTGTECALMNDQAPTSSFAVGGPGKVYCLGVSGGITLSGTNPWSFTVSGLGSTEQGCATVKVTKIPDDDSPSVATIIVAKGYNIDDSSCSGSYTDRIEREIETTY